MPVSKADLSHTLAVVDAEALGSVLDAARVGRRGALAPHELADRIADALWWAYCTPVGYVVDRVSLEDIVADVTRKLGLSAAVADEGDVWAQLGALLDALAHHHGVATHARPENPGVSYDDLGPVQGKLSSSWFPGAASAGGAAGAFAAGVAGRFVVGIGASPIGRLLPLVPYVGPVWKGVRTAGGVAAVAGTPLSIALALVSLNTNLGGRYDQVVPLLLGVAALRPRAVEDAVETPITP